MYIEYVREICNINFMDNTPQHAQKINNFNFRWVTG